MEEYKLKRYVPNIYEDVLEMDELINAEQGLFDDAIDSCNQVLDNAFISTSDVSRIRQYEKLLKIKANPSVEDLDFRRERVLNRISSKPPFTMNWLREKLDVFIGVGNWKVTLMPDAYYLYIKARTIDANWEGELRDLLRKTVPANIEWELAENPYTTYGELAPYTYEELAPYTHEQLTNL